MRKPITVADLPDLGEERGRFLYCRACQSHWSATRGDYFMSSPDYVLTCCDEPMTLARQVTMIEESIA